MKIVFPPGCLGYNALSGLYALAYGTPVLNAQAQI
jgi:hypothetical protein